MAGSYGGPGAPQPQDGINATLARLVDGLLDSSGTGNLTLFFPLGGSDPGVEQQRQVLATVAVRNKPLV